MSELGDAFIAVIGKPDVTTPPGIRFTDPVDVAVWDQIYAEIGSGWYMNRFLYLFGEGLDTLQPCLEAWSFLLPSGRHWTVVGKNAYGSLLLAEDLMTQGSVSPIHVLDTLNVRCWTNPNLDFIGLLGYWLPERFGFDVRRVQYSSLILTGQMTREDALEQLKKPPYDPDTIEQEFEYIATKLRISTDELGHYLRMPKKFYWDYKNQESIFRVGARVLKALGMEASVKR